MMADLTYKQSSSSSLYPTNDPVFIKKGKLGGESDLVRLAETVNDEVLWLYDHSGRTWYNIPSEVIGLHQKGGRHMTGLRSEIEGIPVSGRATTLYHTHSKSAQEKEIDEKVSTLSKLTELEREAVRGILLKVGYAHGHFPSDIDMETFADILGQQTEDFDLSFGIASHLGVTSLSLKPRYEAAETRKRYEELLESVFRELRPMFMEYNVLDIIRRAAQKLNRNEIGIEIHFRK